MVTSDDEPATQIPRSGRPLSSGRPLRVWRHYGWHCGWHCSGQTLGAAQAQPLELNPWL